MFYCQKCEKKKRDIFYPTTLTLHTCNIPVIQTFLISLSDFKIKQAGHGEITLYWVHAEIQFWIKNKMSDFFNSAVIKNLAV